jgi:serine/threonine protein kinase
MWMRSLRFTGGALAGISVTRDDCKPHLLWRSCPALRCDDVFLQSSRRIRSWRPASELKKEYALQLDGALGSGGSAQIYLAEHKKTGISRAVKCVRSSIEESDLQREVDVMQRLQDCPHVVHVTDTFADDSYHYIVMELCFGLDLVDSLMEELHIDGEMLDSHPNIPHVAAVFREMVKAVGECHERHVCHMDIKPENFAHLSAGCDRGDVVKILDFGLAVADVETVQVSTATRLGCSKYLAPELFVQGGNVALKPCDMYALGVSLHNLLTGGFPYAFTPLGRPVSRPNLATVTDPAARDLIGRLLSIDASRRPTVTEVLEHEFVQKHAHVQVKPLLDPSVRSLFTNPCGSNGLQARSIKSGETLYQRGDPSRALYFVSDGSFNMTMDGNVVGTAGPGSVIGEVSALFGHPHHVTAVATEDSTVLECSCDIGQNVVTMEERHAFRRLQELAAEKELRYTKLDFLKSSALFRKANNDFINMLIAASSQTFFDEGPVVQKDRDDKRKLYIVQEGLLELQSPRSTHSIRIGPGDIVGAMELIFGLKGRVKLTAVKPTTALALDCSEFALILSKYVNERQAIVSIAEQRLRCMGLA